MNDADVVNVRAACYAAKSEFPGSQWNDPDGDPVASLDRLLARALAAEEALATAQEAEMDTLLYILDVSTGWTRALPAIVRLQRITDIATARRAALLSASTLPAPSGSPGETGS